MKKTFDHLDKYRQRVHGVYRSPSGASYGLFFIPFKSKRPALKVLSSGHAEWEHVSVSLPKRCPTWNEMTYIKNLFWEDDECVVQYHPPKKDYVNNHAHCLHLWRCRDKSFPAPPASYVGVK